MKNNLREYLACGKFDRKLSELPYTKAHLLNLNKSGCDRHFFLSMVTLLGPQVMVTGDWRVSVQSNKKVHKPLCMNKPLSYM